MNQNLSDALCENLQDLKRHAMSMTRNPADADDIVQECVKRALTYVHEGTKIRNIRAYLYMILNNVFMDELSRRKRCGTSVDIDEMQDLIASSPQQISRLECRDISRAFSRLSAEQKQVVKLIGVDGMSYRAAADALDVPIGTIMSRLNRARSALRRDVHGGELPQ